MTARADNPRSFPGGRVRLPRLDGAEAGDPELTFVGTAFVRHHEETVDQKASSSFAEYYTTESLFAEPDACTQLDLNDPFHVLGVSPHAEWREITIAHRRLAMTFHPDRFAGQPQEILDKADENIRRINMAYAELNRRFHDDGAADTDVTVSDDVEDPVENDAGGDDPAPSGGERESDRVVFAAGSTAGETIAGGPVTDLRTEPEA